MHIFNALPLPLPDILSTKSNLSTSSLPVKSLIQRSKIKSLTHDKNPRKLRKDSFCLFLKIHKTNLEKQKAELLTRPFTDLQAYIWNHSQDEHLNTFILAESPLHFQAQFHLNLTLDLGLSMLNYGFIQIPRSLRSLPLWLDSSPLDRELFNTILSLVVWKETEFNDFGTNIILKPAQVCISIRDLMLACGTMYSKNDVERGLQRLEKNLKIVRREVRHQRCVITITHKDTYDLIIRKSETESETVLRQFRDSFETEKNKGNKENKLNKELCPAGWQFLENIGLLEQNIETLMAFPIEIVEEAVKHYQTHKVTSSFYGAVIARTREKNKEVGNIEWYRANVEKVKKLIEKWPQDFKCLEVKGVFVINRMTGNDLNLSRLNPEMLKEKILNLAGRNVLWAQ